MVGNQWCAGAGEFGGRTTRTWAPSGWRPCPANPERLAKSASLKGAEEFLARINREFLAVKQALRAEKTK